MQRKALLFSLNLLLASFLFAQVTNNGLSLSIDSGTTVSISGATFSSAGNVTNNGRLLADSSIDISGIYFGNGSIEAVGTDQSIAVPNGIIHQLAVSSGIKSLGSDLVVNDLVFSSALVNSDTNRLVVQGSIQGAATDAFVLGQLVRSGSDSLDFPIATNGVYTPVILDQIEGAGPLITVSGVEASPNGIVGKGLLSVSEQRYFAVETNGGSLTAARATLPVINETSAPDVQSLAIAYAPATGATFSGLGQSLSSGNLAEGTLTASTKAGAGIYTFGQYFNEALKEADSLALVSIYENTLGDEWTENGNWLTAEMSSWSGVAMTDKRVREINLAANNLQAGIPGIASGLENVVTLDLADNELESIGELSSMTSVASIDVSNNRLQFGSIEAMLSSYPFLIYAPQKEVLARVETIEDIGTTYTVDRTLTGSANEYRWIKNGRTFDQNTGSFDLALAGFEQDGTYIAQVTNENVPGLTLNTAPVILKVSSLGRDSASLILVYESLVTDSSSISNWPETPIAEWNEVTIDETLGRVTALDLSDASLSGAISAAITDVEGLETADFSGNYIHTIPSLMDNPLNTSVFDVGNNKLDPGDIEPNLNFPGFRYANLKSFGDAVSVKIDRGLDTLLVFDVPGENNEYQWKLDGVFISGAEADSFLLEDINIDNMGEYVLEIRNPVIGESFLLETSMQEILAKADLTITPLYTNIEDQLSLLEDDFCEALLYIPTTSGPYVPLDTIGLSGSIATFEDLVLGDYVVLMTPTAELFLEQVNGQTDSIQLLPTYFGNTIDWVEAPIIELEDPADDTVQMEQQPRELTPADGSASMLMLVESDFPEDEEGGRIEARRRVQKAGCSLRRRSRGGRTDQDSEGYFLIAYKETDADGNVNFGNLPAGEYKINVQYPGVPMDESTEVKFEIEEGREGTEFEANVLITEEGIAVDLEVVLGILREYFTDLTVYPNPADERFTLRYKELYSNDVSMKMISLSGSVAKEIDVKRGFDQEIEVETKELNEGLYMLYFYDATTGEPVLTYKVVIKH